MAKRTPRSQANDRTAPAAQARNVSSPNQAQPQSSSSTKGSELRGPEPSEEEIRLHAYHRYLERGGGHGMDFDDWLRAEQELKQKRNT